MVLFSYKYIGVKGFPSPTRCDFCLQCSIEDRAKIVEFYIHNLVLPNMNIYDPKLITLASWMNDEEIRVEDIKRILSKVVEESLWVREELSTPHLFISNHRIIEENPNMEKIYKGRQE